MGAKSVTTRLWPSEIDQPRFDLMPVVCCGCDYDILCHIALPCRAEAEQWAVVSGESRLSSRSLE
jgi:hypothetical protein